jgi:hypothetical protein
MSTRWARSIASTIVTMSEWSPSEANARPWASQNDRRKTRVPGIRLAMISGCSSRVTPIRRCPLDRFAQVGSWCWPCCWMVTEPMARSEPLACRAPARRS